MSAAPPVQRLHVGVGLVPARLFRSRPRLRPAGRPQGPPLQRTAGCRCSPVSTFTRRGGCPHPPASFVPVPGSGQPGGHKGRPYRERLVAAAPPFQRSHVGAGAHTRPPLSFPSQAPASRAATRAAPTKRGCFPLLPSFNAHAQGRGLSPPTSFLPAPDSRRPGGHKGRPYRERLVAAAPPFNAHT